jgi:hypothetical protein
MSLLRKFLTALFGAAALGTAAAGTGISAQDREDISACIARLVWGGFDTKADIHDAAIYQTQPPVQSPVDLAWLDKKIAQEWAKKRTAEATWPARTDFDRLDDVFKSLRSAGVLALHNAGNTQSDAHSDAGEEWHRLGGPKSELKGFVFYLGQDVEGVITDGNLYIGFATTPNSPWTALELIQRTVLELKTAGFAVVAPKDVDTRILVTGLDWKKRSPE